MDLFEWVSRGVGAERLVTPCEAVGGTAVALYSSWQGERFAAAIVAGGMRG